MTNTSPGWMSSPKYLLTARTDSMAEAVWEGTPSTWETMRLFQSQMAQEKSCTSAKMGEMEVLIMVMPISRLMVSRRLYTTAKVIGSRAPSNSFFLAMLISSPP